MKTNEVMKELNIGRKALLLYEKRGFIHPKRDISDYRIYSDNDVKVLKKIIVLRKMDFSLDEIEKILKKEIYNLSYKRNEYDQKIQELQMKKQFLQKDMISLELDENIDQLFDHMKGDFEEEKELIPFSITKDGFLFLWYFCMILSLYTSHIYLIIMSVLLGISLSLIALRKKKSMNQWLTYLASIMLMICGIIGFYVQYKIDSLMIKCFIVGYSYFLISYGLFLINAIKKFMIDHQKWISNILITLGLGIIFGLLFGDLIFDISSFVFLKNNGYMIQILGALFWVIGIYIKRYVA